MVTKAHEYIYNKGRKAGDSVISGLETDKTFSDASDTTASSSLAIKSYVDTKVSEVANTTVKGTVDSFGDLLTKQQNSLETDDVFKAKGNYTNVDSTKYFFGLYNSVNRKYFPAGHYKYLGGNPASFDSWELVGRIDMPEATALEVPGIVKLSVDEPTIVPAGYELVRSHLVLNSEILLQGSLRIG